MNVQLFGEWKGAEITKLEEDFGEYEKPLTGHFNGEDVLGIYTYENYSGSAVGLVFRGDRVFQFSGSHCSCNGLEGSGELSPVTLAYVAEQLEKGIFAPQTDYPNHETDQWDAFRASIAEALKTRGVVLFTPEQKREKEIREDERKLVLAYAVQTAERVCDAGVETAVEAFKKQNETSAIMALCLFLCAQEVSRQLRGLEAGKLTLESAREMVVIRAAQMGLVIA